MMHLPTLQAPRGPIHVATMHIPAWLDSTSKPITLTVNEDEFQVKATGGFCGPSVGGLAPWSLSFTTWSDHDIFLNWKRKREAELAAQRLIPRAKRWWRAHWWPAIIADLTAQLRDEDYYD